MSKAQPGAPMGGERSPLPQIIGRRTVELHLRRVLKITVTDDGTGKADVLLAVYNDRNCVLGQLHVKPFALRPLAAALTALAGELGIEP